MANPREICDALNQIDLTNHEAVSQALDPLGVQPIDWGSDSSTGVVYADDGYTYRNVNGIVEPGPTWVDVRVAAVEVDNRVRFHMPDVAADAVVAPSAQVHPTARIESGANIGDGAVVGPYALVSRGAIVGANSVVAQGASIGHDTVVAPHTVIAEGATVGNRVVVGQHAHLGRASIIQSGAEVPPDHRVPERGRVERNMGNPYRATQIAAAVDRLLQIDR